MNRRRLSLQLTPLLDLLLIVIFAQHMEVLQGARMAEAEVQSQKASIVAELQQMQIAFEAHKAELEMSVAARQSATEQERQELHDRLESIRDQQQQAASAMADALRLPAELLEQVARLRADGKSDDAQRLQEASDRMGQLLKSRGREFLQFVIRFDEMQKHVSVWEIHLQDNGQALFTDGQQSHTISYETTDELSARVFQASKSLSEPRILVLLLLTYGDAQAGARRRAVDTMPILIEKLRRDAGNTRWYDFALMGYRPDGPIFQSGAAESP